MKFMPIGAGFKICQASEKEYKFVMGFDKILFTIGTVIGLAGLAGIVIGNILGPETSELAQEILRYGQAEAITGGLTAGYFGSFYYANRALNRPSDDQ